MAVRPIVQLGDPILHKKAKKVHRVDQYTRQLVDDLIDTVKDAPGYGLAAPQIGVPLRALVVNLDDKLQVMFNPEITETSDEMVEADEGCLSIPGWQGPVTRHERITVRGMGRTGKPLKVRAEEWEARVYQHEIDHLNGVLFIDRMDDKKRLYKVGPEDEDPDADEEM